MSNGAAAGIAAGMAVENAQRREIARLRADLDEAVGLLCRICNEHELPDRGVLKGVPAALGDARAFLSRMNSQEGKSDG